MVSSSQALSTENALVELPVTIDAVSVTAKLLAGASKVEANIAATKPRVT